MNVKLRLTGRQKTELFRHLFPCDGCEAVSVAICGRRDAGPDQVMIVRKFVHIPYSECKVRTPFRVSWSTNQILPLLEEAMKRNYAVVKFHSHPTAYSQFSETDDLSDKDVFQSVHGWTDSGLPHGSVVMLPDKSMFGRAVLEDGSFIALHSIAVAGDDLEFFYPADADNVAEFAMRHAQIFGEATTQKIGKLSVAVIGCSGTGGPVIEQLSRLGVGRLVLVDPDSVEVKNLNRIPNTTMDDAKKERPKVKVLETAIKRIDLGTIVTPLHSLLNTPDAVREVAGCDIAFGCMDGVEGRHILSRLCAFYSIPYFDLGVKLVADGKGGIDEVCGAVHYVQPDGSSLIDRRVYTLEQVRAAALKRADPTAYQEQLKSKYIQGVNEEAPAVVSVNAQIASIAVNEFLARLHPYRYEPNSEFAITQISLIQGQMYHESEEGLSNYWVRNVGRGDVSPLLDMPELSEESS
jgi:hypothetical protein